MENITFVMMNTSNSFEQIMQMKYGAFLSTIKNIRVSQLMQNPEWCEAYQKYQYREALKEGKVVKHTKMDLDGLIAMQSSL